jgi:membrane dipeptidase
MSVTPQLSPDVVFDGHNDAVTRYSSGDPDEEWAFLDEVEYGHIDLPRARRGKMVGGFFAICPPPLSASWDPGGANRHVTLDGFRVDLAPAIDIEYARSFTDPMIDRLSRVADESDEVVVVENRGDVDDALRRGALAAVLHFEGAEALGADLEHLDHYFARGLRSVGPVWSRPNAFGTGVPFAFPCSPDTGPGLTDAGKELVRACDGLGIMIDLAHMNERGFWDVAEATESPIVVTHAGVHALAPTARNLTDRQIDAIAESGGVVGITFFVGDLRDDGRYESNTPIEVIVRHVQYIADRVGPEHVALGSDFDGARIPSAVGDVTGLPKVVAGLRNAGFDDDALSRVTHRNWLRILQHSLPAD